MGKKCFAPSKTGKFCWKSNFPPSKCKDGTYRSFHPGGKATEVWTSCRMKGGKRKGKTAIQRVGKKKLKAGKCPRPTCKRGIFA